MESESVVKPLRSPIKYPGGKRKLFAEINQRLPPGSFKYAEPFFGGGSIGLQLAGEGRLTRFVAGEACGPVRAFWEALHCGALSDGIRGQIMSLLTDHGPEDFAMWRNRLNELAKSDPLGKYADLNQVKIGVLFYALNQTCMNGLVRFNSSGEFNAPVGKKQDGSYYQLQPDFYHLDRVRAALVGARFEIRPSWRAVTELVMGSDGEPSQWAIYMDPPYTGGFVDYTAEGWSSDDDIELYEAARELGAVRERVVISQPDTEWARDCCSSILKGWQVDKIQVGRPINSDGEGRGPVGELLVWNKPVERVMVPVTGTINLRCGLSNSTERVFAPAEPSPIVLNITVAPDDNCGLV
jgi:DNA adenine methylase